MSKLLLFGTCMVFSYIKIYNGKKEEYKIESITSKDGLSLARSALCMSLIPSSIITITFCSIQAICDFVLKIIFALF